MNDRLQTSQYGVPPVDAGCDAVFPYDEYDIESLHNYTTVNSLALVVSDKNITTHKVKKFQ